MGHIRFPDDDEELEDADVQAGTTMHAGPSSTWAPAPAAGPSALPAFSVPQASQAPVLAHCCSTARVDFDSRNPCYVFKAVPSPDGSGIAAALSNHAIKTYACQAGTLAAAGDIAGAHQDMICDVAFPLADMPHALYSCSRDGTVKGWDLRSRQEAECYAVAGQELLSFCVCDNMVVAGGQGDVHFWERRTRQKLETFDDMHMDDVTQVVMHAASRKLLTASQDGLVAVHDMAAGPNQDDGFEAALNVGTSVEELGLYGAGEERLWCRTGTETLQLWEWLRATREEVEGGDMAFLDLGIEARDLAVAAATSGGKAVATHFKEVNYFVGCHFDAPSEQLLLLAGTNDGAVAFLPVAERASSTGQLPPGTNPLGPPAAVLQGTHTDIVRSLRWLPGSAGPLCVTAGEDARVCLWSLQQQARNSGHGGAAPGAARRSHLHPEKRRSPY